MTITESAHQEMAYEMAESGIRDAEYPVSIPCQLRFTETPEQDTERFHQALSDRGWSKIDHDPDRYHEPGKPNWQGEIVRTGVWKRLRIIVFRGGVVRIYPREDEPTVDELAEVVEALEKGFSAPLEHDPITQ